MKNKCVLFWIILLFKTVCPVITKSKSYSSCNTIKRELAQTNAAFVQCVINESVPPVSLCENCKSQFNFMKEKYDDIFRNKTCKEQYFNKNRLNVIESMFLNSKNLWDKAFCSECFDEDNVIKDLVLAVKNAFQCLNNPQLKLKDICKECLTSYTDANALFRGLEIKKNGQICFDIQDLMNITRIKWSKELKCCKREINLTIFASVSTCFLTLPIIFYTGLIFYNYRRNHNQEILSAADLDSESRPNIQTGTQNNRQLTLNQQCEYSNAEQPSSSNLTNNNAGTSDVKRHNDQSDSEDDDEDNSPISQKIKPSTNQFQHLSKTDEKTLILLD